MEEEARPEMPARLAASRFFINALNVSIFLAGIIIIIIFSMSVSIQENPVYWILSISWIISMIFFTAWRFTKLKNRYLLKAKERDQRGIRLLVIAEFLLGVVHFSWYLVLIGAYIGTELNTIIFMATTAPIGICGLLFIFMASTGVFTKDIFEDFVGDNIEAHQ